MAPYHVRISVSNTQGACSFLWLIHAGKKPQGKRRLGFIKIDVADVVENRRITDTWALMDSQQGEIQMKLEWMPLQLEKL